MHYPVSATLDDNAIVFTPPGSPHDSEPSVVWIVVLTTWRVTVLERTLVPGRAWTLLPVPGMELSLGSHLAVPEEKVHARLMALLAGLLVVCKSGGRFDQLIVVGDEPLRVWFKRYLDAATRAAVLAEYDPQGLISKSLAPTRRFGLRLQRRHPVLFPLVDTACVSRRDYVLSGSMTHDVLS